MYAAVSLAILLHLGTALASPEILTPAAVLYDQTSSAASGLGVISQDYSDSDFMDNQAADDFQVPSGFTWKVTKVTAPGGYFGDGPAEGVFVFFYSNTGAAPGSIVCSYAFPAFTGQANGSFVITLPGTGCTLTPGAYWVSVQARLSSESGEWHWRERTAQSLNPYVWRSNSSGACPVYRTHGLCLVGGGNPDLVFKLEGTATAGCTSNSQCDDSQPCTTDTCDVGTGQCSHTNGPPGEVVGFGFCGADKQCLQWSHDNCATSHRVYMGTRSTLPGLLDGAADSCLIDDYAADSTGSLGLPAPPAGSLQWFLATALNAYGEGSAGAASQGPRHIDPNSNCRSPLVINEVDYDMIGLDSTEFVEIYNPTALPQPLSGLALVFNNGAFNGGEEYLRADLSLAGSVIQPGQYLVVADNATSVNPSALVIRFSVADNNIQNGAPDGLCLFDTATNTVIDALSYEGSITAATIFGAPGTYNLVEGNPTSAADSNSVQGSLARIPNGSDTDNAQSDWVFSSSPTPGTSNVP